MVKDVLLTGLWITREGISGCMQSTVRLNLKYIKSVRSFQNKKVRTFIQWLLRIAKPGPEVVFGL